MKLPTLKIGHLHSPLPIIQGGMGIGISLSGLASAVANQGAIGVISAAMPGMDEPDISTNSSAAHIRALKKEIRRARMLTSGIIGVNIMVALSNYSDMVRASIQEGADIIFSGAGLPLNLPGFLTSSSRTKLVPIVSSPRATRIICHKWLSRYSYLPDAIVVEGPMAGGHVGFKPDQIEDPEYTLENLVAKVLEVVKSFADQANHPIPVIAAGGIFNGQDIFRFMLLGASGVQMGTRFVATHECDAAPAFKQAYVKAHKQDMVIIKSPVGMPGRAIRNKFLNAVEKGRTMAFHCAFHCLKTCKRKSSPYCIAQALANARRGILKDGFAFAGKNAYKIDRIISVKELISSLIAEFSSAVAMEAVSANTLLARSPA